MSLWDKDNKKNFGFDISRDKDTSFPPLKEISLDHRPESKIAIDDKDSGDRGFISTSYINRKFFLKTSRKGGMGIVYIAENESDNKFYTLKTIREDRLKSFKTEEEKYSFIKRFMWESQVWAILGKHRNIVQAYWFDKTYDNKPLLILEFVEGHPEYGNTLYEWLMRTTLDIPTILDFTIEALTGILYAQRKIKDELHMVFVHRDLKPSNIMITRDGIVKVTDFGLVKAFASIEGNLELKVKDDLGERFSVLKTGGICGTPPYMAPEQWYGKEPDERTDIYAMGCIMYGMITGKPPFAPFPGPRFKEFKEQHLYEKPLPPKRSGEEIPEELSVLILKCLEKEKVNRVQTIYELREALQEIHKRLTGKKIEVKDEPEKLDATTLNYLGSGFYNLGLWDKAISYHEKALEIDPNFAWAHNNLANALKDKGIIDEAIEHYQKAVSIDPKYAIAYRNLGRAYENKGLFDEAIDCVKKAVEIDPKDVSAHNNLGWYYYKKGMLDEAIECYKKALEIDPSFATAHANIRLALKEKGSIDEAIKKYKEAIRINPQDAVAHYELGRLFMDNYMYDEAIGCFKNVIRINPQHVDAHNELGRIYDNKGLFDEALEYYLKVIDVNPFYHHAYNNIGWIYHNHKSMIDEAIEYYKKAIGIKPNYAMAWNNMGFAYYKKGMLDEAVVCYKKALAIESDHEYAKPNLSKVVYSYTNMGENSYAKGMIDKAIEYYKKAIGINPKYARAHFNLGNALYEKGLFDQAINCYKEAIRINPEYAAAHN
ncbi:MAG: hypothetical protein DRP81_09385, partial [Candidatus Omnitrophota bacterium]